ncbi:MarR family transcriptional regulator [Altererythrobacter soli]|uniref:MarR family transcriptional regulator n=1 Tax=Croceibacterium soli TaxID=1739690 RepID=A0A6I4UUD4_9SPHN|nr:MarR family transcriptional regulator [Croceibacterium soli]MXP41133.1 MarR family transcriptional regulator [Croceibacterium soli]
MNEHDTSVPRLPGEPMRRRLISSRLINLLQIVRETAQSAYAGVGLTEHHRQVVLLVGNYEQLTSGELVVLTGTEKAQVSRTVKALEDAGLVERAGRRSPIVLTAKGRTVFEETMQIARSRNAILTVGLGEADVAHLLWMTRQLTARAAVLFAHERQVSAESADQGGGTLAEPPLPDYGDGLAEEKPMGTMIFPALHALLSYMKRSASLSYQREHGLSHFEWMVFSQIGEHQPLSQARLITMVRRNKSQVGRTIAFLEQQKLISRQHQPGRKENLLKTTDPGWETYVSMCGLAIGREDFLLAETSRQDRNRYMAALDRITTNAELELSRQKGQQQVRSTAD